MENDAEIFAAHSTWKVPEKGFKIAFMMNTLSIMNSCEIIFFFAKNHCEIQVSTILVCTLKIQYAETYTLRFFETLSVPSCWKQTH
jgi:hypothetical protein